MMPVGKIASVRSVMALAIAVLCLAPAKAAEQTLCQSIAGHASAHREAPLTLRDLLDHPVKAPRQSFEAGNIFPPEISERWECAAGNADCAWIASASLGMMSIVQGTAGCVDVRFARKVGQRFSPVSLPAGIHNFPCWDDGFWFGTVSGMPALVEENAAAGDRARTMAVSLWYDNAWQKVCHLSETHSIRLKPGFASCAAGTPCTQLQEQAQVLAGQAQHRRETLIPATGHSRTDGLHVDARMPVPAGRTPVNGYQDIFGASVSELDVAGHRYRFTVGGGMIGWRIYDGWLVRVEALPQGQPPVPVAGFQFERVPDRILSLRASP